MTRYACCEHCDAVVPEACPDYGSGHLYPCSQLMDTFGHPVIDAYITPSGRCPQGDKVLKR